MAAPIHFGGTAINPGERRDIELPLPLLYTHTQMTMPVQVLHGRRRGPCLLLNAALHGDELNGAEIVRRTITRLDPAELRGTLVAVPIVNVFAFINQSRYLPDRRDLNRCFPGTHDGSLGARLAHQFFMEVVMHCTHGIDIHTAAQGRINLPQIRADLQDAETNRCARAFGAPVMIHRNTLHGSLREAAVKAGVRLLVYEGGEPLRFDEDIIELGVNGVLRVMAALKMRKHRPRKPNVLVVEIASTRWVRARQSGIFRLAVQLGDHVKRGQTLGSITDPFGENRSIIRAAHDGLVIGHTVNPLVHRGDAAVHLGIIPRDA